MARGQEVDMGRERRLSSRSTRRSRSAVIHLSTSLVVSVLFMSPTVEASLASSRGTGGPQMQESWTRLRRRRTPSPPHDPHYEVRGAEHVSGDRFLSQPACALEEIIDSVADQGEEYSSDPFLSSYDESDEPDRNNIHGDDGAFLQTDTSATAAECYPLIDGSTGGLVRNREPPVTYEHGAHRYELPPSHYYNSNSIRCRDHATIGAAAAAAAAAATVILKAAATVAVVIAALTPLARALSSHWPYFVAGGICASVSHTAAVPLDVIKTRMQCAQPGEYRGTWDAFVRICRSEGAQVLFCGAGATLIGYAMQGCLKFGFFEFLKPFFSSLFLGGVGTGASETPLLGSLVAASVAAEVVGSSALTPLEAARIRMVADSDYAPGLRSGIARMISEEGLGALTRGLPAVLAKQIPYTVTKLVTFDVLVRAASRAASCGCGSSSSSCSSQQQGGRRGVALTLCCAVVAGILSSLASQPGDSLLSTLNSEGRQGEEKEEVEGWWEMSDGTVEVVVAPRESVARAMARIAREAGFFGLFRGTTARMMHVTSVVTVQLLIYQTVKSMVGISN